MRIALIKPPLVGHANRGIGVYTTQLHEHLKLLRDIEVELIEYTQIPTGFDIYHFPYFDPFFLTLPAKKPGKTVITIHDMIPIKFPQHFPRGVKGEFKWQLEKRRAKNADAIITDSYASKVDIHTHIGISEKYIHPIYLAAAEEFKNPSKEVDRKKVTLKYQLPKQFILFVGETNWNKNLRSAIAAAKKVQFPLVVVSKSFAEAKLEKYHSWQQGLKDAEDEAFGYLPIIRLGAVSTSELHILYELATALVFPSFYEGFGLPVVEAFTSGCPVICSDCGSLKEIATGAALIVEPSDIEAISQAISALSKKNTQRTRLIAAGLKQAKAFSWVKTAEMTVKVYNTISSTP
jgi:glycosyltransferase involved in cell wall biosynthesis